ncbi:hypothetical protein CAEBREN_24039 [Caenorhabditis brenneri]|uniref:3'-5' exonuclease domain-containing protein n=1 Tax=Caenorhabditis brenneri TaxID=135651 RepID=G0NI28_CAEBE|nr:hypothetical protein CAEBREN_24039 [Caenorhabditis brenneri]
MAQWIANRHRKFNQILIERNNPDKPKKRIGEPALVGVFLYATDRARYAKEEWVPLVDQIEAMRKLGALQITDTTFEKMSAVLRTEDDEAIKELREWQRKISYRLHYPHLKDLKIKITKNKNDGVSFMKQYFSSLSHDKKFDPLYLDTENAHHKLREERDFKRLALITIFDTYTSTVLLFRVHRFNDKEIEEVREALRGLHRFFVTFDDEKILSSRSESGSISFLDLQCFCVKEEWNAKTGKKCERLQSLKDAVAEHPLNINLHKDETMSDWTAPLLTHDQICYAAMDAVVLHELEKKVKSKEEDLKKEEIERQKREEEELEREKVRRNQFQRAESRRDEFGKPGWRREESGNREFGREKFRRPDWRLEESRRDDLENASQHSISCVSSRRLDILPFS